MACERRCRCWSVLSRFVHLARPRQTHAVRLDHNGSLPEKECRLGAIATLPDGQQAPRYGETIQPRFIPGTRRPPFVLAPG